MKVAGNYNEKIEGRVHRWIARELRSAKRIVDVGCGDCGLARLLAGDDRNRRVTGVGVSGAEFACKGLCLVSVWSAASAHARMQVPVIERLAPRFAGRAVFCRLNLDAGSQTAERYGIKSCPMLLMLRDGKELNRLVGVCGESEVLRVVEEACATA